MTIFLRVLIIIFANCPKNAKFCTHKQRFHSLVAFSTLQLNDWSSHSQVKIAKFNTCKVIIIPKLRKKVPVNNNHLKVACKALASFPGYSAGAAPSLWPGNEASKAWKVEVEVVGREKGRCGMGRGKEG